jgi:hypothetical protein
MVRRIGLPLLSFLALAAVAPPAQAWEAACTAAERKALAEREKRALAALREGDVRKWAEVMKAKGPALSATCRKQQVRVSPATDRCTRDEKLLVLQKQKQSLRAAAELDLDASIKAMEELQDGVSPACWIALSYPQDPEIQEYCVDQDLLELAGVNSRWVEEARWAIDAVKGEDHGDMEESDDPLVSLVCQAMVSKMRAERPKSASHFGGTALSPGSLADGAPGTFLVPGVGACTPKACIVL